MRRLILEFIFYQDFTLIENLALPGRPFFGEFSCIWKEI